MKQRGLFEDSTAQENIKTSHHWELFVDGASRNNPGPSGAGICLIKNAIVFIQCGYYLGIKTNNQAEYLALLFGLFVLSEHVQTGDTVRIVSDSQLLVRQLMGIYKVKQPHLQPLHAACKERMRKLSATIAHVLRDQNTQADAMANYGVDNKQLPPKNYIAMLNNYDIIF